MPVQSQSSTLLSMEDNQQVHRLLGNRCQSLSTAVVQLYTTQAPHHNQYVKQDVGVLCFVKDNIKKSYFFRLYNLLRNALSWEHEMYENMSYSTPEKFLHVFEGEDAIVAFSFASNEEAHMFKGQVVKRIEMKRRKAEIRAQNNQRNENNNALSNNNDVKMDYGSSKRSSGKKTRITKADIGCPTNFQHISHVGWNQSSGFDVETNDEQLKTFFDKAGVSEKHLRDKDTRDFIYDFIAKNGGREAVAEVNKNERPPAPTPNSHPVPPVPPRGAPKPPHVRAAPPPPPSRPPPMKVDKSPPPPSNNTSAPPPPPPPPMMLDNMDGPTSPQAPPPPPGPANNSALMASIVNGTTLRPVEERQLAPAAVPDARNDLLSEIRKGFALKPVSEREVATKATPSRWNAGDGCDLASALARALADRKDAINNSGDDSDESSDNEWEDD